MCGIVGVASQRAVDNLDLIERMRDTMTHRGPDDAGSFVSPDGRCWLAMRRLAVVDLTHAGHQPMADVADQVNVVLNGEIYNHNELRSTLEREGHVFRSRTDTEVLLAAYRQWGAECLTRLNGMFAFAIHDARNQSIFLARDRAGEKPLFYSFDGYTLRFASELKALFVDPSLPRVIDEEALEQYLAYGYVSGSDCLVAGFNKLGAAEAMTLALDGGHLDRWRYWSLPMAPTDADPEELEQEAERLLRQSIRLRLSADVPVGVLLSGGLDSSIITALASEVAPGRVKTFTIAFPGHGPLDEGPYARQVADHFSTDHIEFVAHDSDLSVVADLTHQFDEPIADSSMIPTYLVSKLVRRDATVALGGDGGDELFGGYPHHSWLVQRERLVRGIPRPLRSIALGAGQRLPIGFRGRNYALSLGAGDPTSRVNTYFDPAWRRMLRPMTTPHRSPEDERALLGGVGDIAARAMRADFHSYLVDDILVKVDRASMLCSLEVRAPFLDHNLIEFAFQLPTHLRSTRVERKVLLRRIGKRLLPQGLDLHRKQGFSLPLDNWLRGPWRSEVESVLLDPAASFDRAAVLALLKSQAQGRPNANRIFSLWFFELWRAKHHVAFS